MLTCSIRSWIWTLILYFYVLNWITHRMSCDANFLFFKNDLKTRDEAHFCCRKYGMSLLSIQSEKENAFIAARLQSSHSKVWLGVFSSPDNPNDVVWEDMSNVTYQNLDHNSEQELNKTRSGATNSYNICFYGNVSNGFIWHVGSCNEKLDYGCQTVNGSMDHYISPVISDAQCPHLVKMTSDNLSRAPGTVDSDGRVMAGTYGYFKVRDVIKSLGNQLGVVETKDKLECIFRCLLTYGCNDIIMFNKFYCFMYQLQ